MSDMRSILVDTASRLFADLCTTEAFNQAEQGVLDGRAWNLLEQAGLTRATVPEAVGGDGSDLGDALMLVRAAGSFALPLPLVDTLLAQRVLAAAGLPAQVGVGSVAPVTLPSRRKGAAQAGAVLATRDGKYFLSGTVLRVPAARYAQFVAVITKVDDSFATVLVSGAGLRAALTRQDVNWANEPRDTLVFRDLAIAPEHIGKTGQGMNVEDLRFEGALFRLAAMSGAMGSVLQLAVQYAKDRVQFGKPIAQYQAIQHGLAVLATQVAAANAAADAAIDAASRGPARFEIAAAKARIGEAAHIANGIAHQVHGAMGFTHEHPLHRSSRRLWAWRDEFGSEGEWAEWVGRAAVRLGGDGLWPFLTALDKQLPG